MATSDPQVDDGADTLADLKKVRARLKAHITRIANQIKVLMRDPENLELVGELSTRLEGRYEEFISTQRAVLRLLTEEDDIRVAMNYQKIGRAHV